MFSERLLDHFENPRNAGELPDSDARVRVENPVCGDVLELSVFVSDQRIHQSRFRAKGCVPLMACSSILTEMIEGLTIAEASQHQHENFPCELRAIAAGLRARGRDGSRSCSRRL